MERRRSIGIAAVVVAAIVALLLTGCATTPRASSRPLLLPSALDTVVWRGCIDGLDVTGLNVSIGGISGEILVDVGPGDIFDSWYVHATSRAVTLVTPHATAPAVSGDSAGPASMRLLGAAERAARSVQRCASAYRFVDANDLPLSRGGLLQLYRYDVAVLWPCLRAHGVIVADQPSRELYLTPVTAAAIDPYGTASWTPGNVETAIRAARECPDVPAYLVNR